MIDIEALDVYYGSMSEPSVEPIGLQLTRTAKVVSRAFDDALGGAGGSLPMWLVLMSLKGRHQAAQRELAEAMGIEGPTLTYHLNRMETAGLVTRTRDPENRRVHRVELTREGAAAFERLLTTVIAFDQRLRAGFTDPEIAGLDGMLTRLRANAGDSATVEPPPTSDT
jgi:MarR family transcriptional regulator for hemolysin